MFLYTCVSFSSRGGGVSVEKGSLPKVVSVQGVSGGLCPGGLCLGVSVQGVSVWGSLSRGSLSGGLCPGGLCLGVSVQGVSVWGSLSGGLCPGALCPGRFSVQGGLWPGFPDRDPRYGYVRPIRILLECISVKLNDFAGYSKLYYILEVNNQFFMIFCRYSVERNVEILQDNVSKSCQQNTSSQAVQVCCHLPVRGRRMRPADFRSNDVASQDDNRRYNTRGGFCGIQTSGEWWASGMHVP